MESHDRVPRAAHPRMRVLLLLVPLTWPGFVYGLWQRRRDVWVALPRFHVGAWWRQVPLPLLAGGIALLISGAVIYGGLLLMTLVLPSAPSMSLLEADVGIAGVESVGQTFSHYRFTILLPLLSLTSLGGGVFALVTHRGSGGALLALGMTLGYLAIFSGNL